MDLTGIFDHRTEREFRKCATNLERLNFFCDEIDNHVSAQATADQPGKSDERSAKLREEGRVHLAEERPLQALDCYTASVAWAEGKGAAALAYCDRSGALSEMGLYRECLIDIQRALKNDCPEELRVKLEARKKDVEKLQKIKADAASKRKSKNDDLLNVSKSQKPKSSALAESPACVEIHNNEKYGRHVIATRNIEIGELLIVEDPIGFVLMRDLCLYCHHCSNPCHNPVPCDACSRVLFCGNKCKATSLARYHKYECGVLDSVQIFDSMRHNLGVALKITVKIFRQLRRTNRSKLLGEVKELTSHADKRPVKTLLAISLVCAFVYKLLRAKTSLFADFESMEDTFKELFPLIVQVIQINGCLVNRLEPHLDGGCRHVAYAQGLYMKYSAFNHSCFPNAFFYHEGRTLYVRALGTIKKGDQCFISYRYTYSTTPKIARQRYLKETFYFSCACRACAEDWPTEDGDDNQDFDKPFAMVMVAQRENDPDLLRQVLPIFANRLKNLERFVPSRGVNCLRQLVADCHQTCRNRRDFKQGVLEKK